MKVAVIMGSKSDFPVLQKTINILKQFDVEVVAKVMSAHRTPDEAHDFSKNAYDNGIEVIIAAAGKAAHLAGVMAAYTTLPVIGLPIKSATMDGLDSLLSTVQMPEGVPVATVAINGGENAGILAIEILSIKYTELTKKLKDYKENMAQKVHIQDKEIQEVL